MLKTRVLTALIIFMVTLAVVFLAPPLVFRVLIAILLLAGCREYGRIADLRTGQRRALVLLQAVVFVLFFVFWPRASGLALPLLACACLAWLPLFFRLSRYRADALPDDAFRRLGFASALLSLTACWFALGWLHDRENGPLVVFSLLLIIWASDTGAYFSGKQFGRRNLAPVISPNKTWEGLAACTIGTFAVAAILNRVFGVGLSWWQVLGVASIFAVAYDERDRGAGRMASSRAQPQSKAPAPTAALLVGLAVAAAVIGTGNVSTSANSSTSIRISTSSAIDEKSARRSLIRSSPPRSGSEMSMMARSKPWLSRCSRASAAERAVATS